MGIKTERINIFKKALPFKVKFKVSYTYFKGKMYIVKGGKREFNRAFKGEFWKLINNGWLFNGLKQSQLFKKYMKFFKNLKGGGEE